MEDKIIQNRIVLYFLAFVYTVYIMAMIVSAQHYNHQSDNTTPDMILVKSNGAVYRVDATEVMRQQCFNTNPLYPFQNEMGEDG